MTYSDYKTRLGSMIACIAKDYRSKHDSSKGRTHTLETFGPSNSTQLNSLARRLEFFTTLLLCMRFIERVIVPRIRDKSYSIYQHRRGLEKTVGHKVLSLIFKEKRNQAEQWHSAL